MRSGGPSMHIGYMRSAGLYGGYWSRSGSASATTYYLRFTASEVSPSDGPNNRYVGFSLRCLQE